MKVLWNNHRDWTHPKAGGAEKTILELGTRWAAQGHEVYLLTSQWDRAPLREMSYGINVLRSPGALMPHLALIEKIRELRPDVVIDDLAHVVPWFSPWLSSVPGVAFFRHLHRRTLRGQVSPPAARLLESIEHLYPMIYRGFDFVVESVQSGTDLAALGVPRKRIVTINPGVDSVRFKPGLLTQEASVVFFAGLRDYKRPQDAIRTLRAVADLGVPCSLTIVGAEARVGLLRHLAQDLGLEKQVRFPGRLSDEDLAHLVGTAWVNLNCSTAEGWGYSALEAAACGVPTVAYDVPGVREALGNGETGVLVPDGDIRMMAQSVRDIIEFREGWTHRCRQFAERYSWDKCAALWSGLLGRLINEDRPEKRSLSG